MKTVRVKDVWVIWDGKEAYGPYGDKAEAESDRIGMERFKRLQDKPGFMTSERKTGRAN